MNPQEKMIADVDKIRIADHKARIAHIALEHIVASDIHHPECILDHCRTMCPVRISSRTIVEIARIGRWTA